MTDPILPQYIGPAGLRIPKPPRVILPWDLGRTAGEAVVLPPEYDNYHGLRGVSKSSTTGNEQMIFLPVSALEADISGLVRSMGLENWTHADRTFSVHRKWIIVYMELF